MVEVMNVFFCLAYFLFCELQVGSVQAVGITMCMERNYSQSEDIRHVDCNTPSTKAVCLICNIDKSFGNLAWYYENPGIQLARDILNLHSKHAGGMTVNECKSQNYSLKLMRPSVNHTLYYCKANDVTLLSFHVKVQGRNLMRQKFYDENLTKL